MLERQRPRGAWGGAPLSPLVAGPCRSWAPPANSATGTSTLGRPPHRNRYLCVPSGLPRTVPHSLTQNSPNQETAQMPTTLERIPKLWDTREQRSADFFCKGRGSKYFRLCRPLQSLSHIPCLFSLQPFKNIKTVLEHGLHKKRPPAGFGPQAACT